MVLVLGIIALVSLNCHQLYACFPDGGDDAAAIGSAFGEGCWGSRNLTRADHEI